MRRFEATSMDKLLRHDRTVRLLASRLETLAVASMRTPGGERMVRHHILAAVAATRHAVDLDLLSPAEADAIWAEVAERHPDAGWCRSGPRLAA
jgi:hypothetical protein